MSNLLTLCITLLFSTLTFSAEFDEKDEGGASAQANPIIQHVLDVALYYKAIDCWQSDDLKEREWAHKHLDAFNKYFEYDFSFSTFNLSWKYSRGGSHGCSWKLGNLSYDFTDEFEEIQKNQKSFESYSS